MRAPNRSLPAVLAVLTANSGAITTGDTQVLSAAVPAGTLVVGSIFRIRAQATNSSTGVPTVRVHFGVNNSTADATVVSCTTPGAAGQLIFEAWCIVRAVGASGTLQGGGYALGVGAIGAADFTTTAAATPNTTTDNFITVSGLCATLGNIVFTSAIIEQLA